MQNVNMYYKSKSTLDMRYDTSLKCYVFPLFIHIKIISRFWKVRTQELFQKFHHLLEIFKSHEHDISSWCEICGTTLQICIWIKSEHVNSSSLSMSAIFIQNLCLKNIFINFISFFFILNLRTVDYKLP